MSPVEDDPAVWSVIVAYVAKFGRQVADSLSFTTPFIGPAFIGAVLSVSRKSYRNKGAVYWSSAVSWSTAAGAVLTPIFAHTAGFPDSVSGSTAALVAILGHEGIGFLFRKVGADDALRKHLEEEERRREAEKRVEEPDEPWDGVDRRKSNRDE